MTLCQARIQKQPLRMASRKLVRPVIGRKDLVPRRPSLEIILPPISRTVANNRHLTQMSSTYAILLDEAYSTFRNIGGLMERLGV